MSLSTQIQILAQIASNPHGPFRATLTKVEEADKTAVRPFIVTGLVMGLPSTAGDGLFMYHDRAEGTLGAYTRTSPVEKADFDFIKGIITIKTKNSIYVLENFELHEGSH